MAVGAELVGDGLEVGLALLGRREVGSGPCGGAMKPVRWPVPHRPLTPSPLFVAPRPHNLTPHSNNPTHMPQPTKVTPVPFERSPQKRRSGEIESPGPT